MPCFLKGNEDDDGLQYSDEEAIPYEGKLIKDWWLFFCNIN